MSTGIRHSFSFAVTLHRVFDSATVGAAVFRAGGKQIKPYEKPGGLYVFAHMEACPITVECPGFRQAEVSVAAGAVTPVTLYPDRLCVPPAGWKLVQGVAAPGERLYWVDPGYELKLMEFDAERSCARIRSKNGLTGGCLLLSAEGADEAALILEKQSPDLYYLHGLTRSYDSGTVKRIYCARADEQGEFYVVVPDALDIQSL